MTVIQQCLFHKTLESSGSPVMEPHGTRLNVYLQTPLKHPLGKKTCLSVHKKNNYKSSSVYTV